MKRKKGYGTSIMIHERKSVREDQNIEKGFTTGLRFRAGLTLLLLLMAIPALAEPAGLPVTERQKIEALIGTAEARTDVRFIRNGRIYSAATAARFLRGKWEAQAAGIHSAEEFIAKVGSFSSTTGRPYLIELHDGRRIPSALFLNELLRGIQKRK